MLQDKLTDEELMVMYQNGAENAFQELYARHSSKIYGFLKRKIYQAEKVTDIYQEVFIKIHRSKHLYNKSFPFLPWIFTITKSVLIDEIRKDKKSKFTVDFDIEQIPAVQNTLSFISESEEFIQALPEQQKVAIQLRYVDDKTFEEIAESLKTTPLNVRQIVSRGIKRLKHLMNQGDPS